MELRTREQAERAIQHLNGDDLLGRPVKIGPGVASSKKNRSPREQARNVSSSSPVFERWTRIDASGHWTGYSGQGRRVWVGGLPRMKDHDTVDQEVRTL